MIYTCTLNPSVDYFIKLNELKLGEHNINSYENYTAGGKGINVSTVLNNLEKENIALGFIAGFTGRYIEEHLELKPYINQNMIEVSGETRLNINMLTDRRTIIKSKGTYITKNYLEQLMNKMEQIRTDDVFILSGSAPNGIDLDAYEQIVEKINNIGATLIVDATKEYLLSTLKYNPFLIKPNRDELEETFNVKLNEEQDYVTYGKKLIEKGARNVLLSLGKDGAILINQNKVYRANTINEQAINPVGAGDSMVAGFIYEYIRSNDLKQALKFSVASGTATALSEEFATKNAIMNILSKIMITEINLK